MSLLQLFLGAVPAAPERGGQLLLGAPRADLEQEAIVMAGLC